MAKKWYAVKCEEDYNSMAGSDIGSTRKREAVKIANQYHKEYPYSEIGLAVMTIDDDYVDKYIVIHEKRRNEEMYKNDIAIELSSAGAFGLTKTISGEMAKAWEQEAEEMLQNINLDDAAVYMDQDIELACHATLAPCKDVEFLAYYMAAHKEKYSESFVIN